MAKMRIKKLGATHPSAVQLQLTIGDEIKRYGCIKDLLEEHDELSRYIVNLMIDGKPVKKFPNYKIEKIY